MFYGKKVTLSREEIQNILHRAGEQCSAQRRAREQMSGIDRMAEENPFSKLSLSVRTTGSSGVLSKLFLKVSWFFNALIHNVKCDIRKRRLHKIFRKAYMQSKTVNKNFFRE